MSSYAKLVGAMAKNPWALVPSWLAASAGHRHRDPQLEDSEGCHEDAEGPVGLHLVTWGTP